MTTQDSIQSVFLDQVRKNLAPHMSLADELSEILSISRDSAYRRIRGETILSLDEVKKLCDYFKVSLDAFLSPSSEMVSFQFRTMDMGSFEKWLESILANLEMINSFPEKELIYNSKDLPIFHFFQFPRLSTFKMYFWMRSFTHQVNWATTKYREDIIGKNLVATGERIWEKYAAIPSVELISFDVMNITLRHIQFIHECGMFQTKNNALDLLDDCSNLVAHLKSQAESGIKKTFQKEGKAARLALFINEVTIGENSILFKMGDKRVSFVTTNNFDILTTSNERFCQLTEDHVNNLINKSIPICNTAEKERNKFFNKLEDKIQETRSEIR